MDPTRRRSPKDKGRVERAVQPTRDDCFAGEVLADLESARRRARTWCQQEYGLRRHTRTLRLPLEQFEAEERPALGPVPAQPYDTPQWSDPKVARDQHAQVARALYSLPRQFEGRRIVGQRLRARCDRSLVRFYLDSVLVKTHARQPPGGRSTDPADFPAEALPCARRDIDFIAKQADEHGAAVGAYARALLAGKLPWTRMRRVYALLGLCKRLGGERVNEACAEALAVDMVDVRRLQRLLERARPTAASGTARAATVVPLSRYLRPVRQYAIVPADSEKEER